MNLIILFETDKIENNIYRLVDNRAVHIINILKLKKDDTVKVGFIGGPKGVGQIIELDKKTVTIGVEHSEPEVISLSNIDLIVALPRPQILKKVLFICGMTNINRLHLIRSRRVEKSYYQSPLLKEDNIKKQLIDGMMQGENLNLCKVTVHKRFKNFFEDDIALHYDQHLKFLAENNAQNSLTDFDNLNSNNLLIAIGPEGGWIDFEIDLMKSVGFNPITLGSYNLRVEYAVNAVLSQLSLLNLR